MALSLSGSLEKDPANAPLLDKWEFLYSTDLTTTIDATKNANWVTADQIQDFSKSFELFFQNFLVLLQK